MSDLTEPMATKNSNPITGITLEGFQVFDKPTYIPLDRLTLLFGPNSAGKSAVQDAIELYEWLMSKQAMAHHNAYALLERHWRRTGGGEDCHVKNMRLAVIHSTEVDVHAVMEHQLGRKIWGEFLANNGHAWKLESRWHFERADYEEKRLTFETCFELFIESELVVRNSASSLTVNLNHSLFSHTELHVDFAAVAKTYPNEITLNDGELTVEGYFFGFHPSGSDLDEVRDRWLRYSHQNPEHVSYVSSSLFFGAIKELNLLLDCILSTANGNSRLKPINVEASRTIPTRQDLTFQIGDLDDPMQTALPLKYNRYQSLAVSLAGQLTNSQEIIFSEALQKSHGFPEPAKKRKFADAVNRALTDHLFIEHGYRLDYDFRLLMSKANSQAAIDGYELDTSEFGFLVELFLRDSKGRKHLFEDVGSGIGYLLPVLCAVFERSDWCSTCFIQQPELHIHPALQAAMGDVFIEGSEENRQVLIETHSEHLLLRILKRIRQTHLQASIAPELRINADDVCVLYFDPLPDGTTSVKRLRITEDGEFMDRWPNGFFAERDQELLDE
jgi:predicted ATPase